MPNAMLRAKARTMPDDNRQLRARLAAAAERIIIALDALDAPEEDLEDGHDAEEEIAEPSLGSTNDVHQEAAWQNTYRDADLEHDDAELIGIGDEDGLKEQTVGEPSLGATDDVDQRIAWGRDRASFVIDGEATGTVEDIELAGLSEESWKARRVRQEQTRADLRVLLHRRRK
jgi:hypothetical protein